ncbi:MAG: hypothetical protein QM496_01885 [Verrucomicrobiota bacterium]
MSEDKEGTRKWYDPGMIAGYLALMVGLWFVLTGIIWCLSGDMNQAAAIGDSFGAVNALFSGIALVGVAVAVILQSTELRDSRIAQQKSAKELERQNEVQEIANKLKVYELELTIMSSRIDEANAEVMWHKEFIDKYNFEQANGSKVTKYGFLDERYKSAGSQLVEIENDLSRMMVKRAALTIEIFDLRKVI